MKLRAIIIILIIAASLIPVYIFTKFLQRVLRPRDSMGRLMLYMLALFATIFIYTFAIVFLVRTTFPLSQRP